MSYPAISPCAMAPIVQAASRRRARLASSAHHLENGCDGRASTEHGTRYRSTSGRSMLELQPVNVGCHRSDSPAKILSSMAPSMEWTSQENLHRHDNVRNYAHLVQISPPVSANECTTIDHNGNNDNCHPYNDHNLCSKRHDTDNYRCNTRKHQREVSHLCTNTSLPRMVTDDKDPGDLIPTIFSPNAAGVDEMTEADQDIHENSHEDGLLERGGQCGPQRYLPEGNISALHSEMMSCRADDHADVQPRRYVPEGNISALHSEMMSCRADDHAEVQPDTGVVYTRNSSDICTISPITASSAEMKSQKLGETHIQPEMKSQKLGETHIQPEMKSQKLGETHIQPEMKSQKLGETHIQPDRDTPHSLILIGRCSIYLDRHTGEYRSMVYGSFPRDGHCSLNTMKEESGRHRSTLDSHEDLLLLNSEPTASCSLPNMSTHRLSSHPHTARVSRSHVCVSSKRDCVDGSVGDCEPCCEFERSFEDDVYDDVRAPGRLLSAPGRHLPAPGHQNLSECSDGEQLVHTYPGAVACKSEATVRTQAHVSTCEGRDINNLSTLTRGAVKSGAVCQRSCVHVPSHSVSEDNPTTIQQTNKSPTYFPLAWPCTYTDDQANEAEKAGHPHASQSSKTEESFSQVIEQKGQNLLQFSTKHNTPISSLSSMFRNLVSGKARDKPQTNTATVDRREQDPNNVSKSESQHGVTAAADNKCYIGDRHLTNQTPAAKNRQRSPQECNQKVCQNSNNLAGSDKQTCAETVAAPDDDNTDDNSEAKKQQLRTYRELTRNYTAYLCCPPDALINFGLPFHHLLESWGLHIFIPERDLLASGPKYPNMAACVEESCNGKIIVILSKTYATSDECLFLTCFAKTLDPDARHRNIIPVVIDSDVEIPSVLMGLSLIRYNHQVRSGWLKKKLIEAIAA